MTRPTVKYALDHRPPVCLHILGQGLVNACHAEARALLEYCHELESDRCATQMSDTALTINKKFIEENKDELNAMEVEKEQAHNKFLEITDQLIEATAKCDWPLLSKLTAELSELRKSNDEMFERHQKRISELLASCNNPHRYR